MKKLVFAMSFFCTALISCSVTESENKPLYAPGHSAPVSEGIIITGKFDPTEIGVWGNPPIPRAPGLQPNQHPGLANYFWLDNPFPNPANAESHIRFSLPKNSNVRLYIVRARLNGTPDYSTSALTGGYFISPQGIAVKVIYDQMLTAGRWEFTWDLTDDNRIQVPAGIYRVFMEAADNFFWRDILVYRHKEDLPAELREDY